MRKIAQYIDVYVNVNVFSTIIRLAAIYMQETYSISELSREFGITTRAIRFYEDKELLSPQREAGRRIYSRADRTRLKLLLRGKRLGWPLEEIKAVLKMYDAGDQGELKQLEYTQEKIEQRRLQLLQQKKDIDAALADLDNIQQRCVSHLATLNSCKDKTKSLEESLS